MVHVEREHVWNKCAYGTDLFDLMGVVGPGSGEKMPHVVRNAHVSISLGINKEYHVTCSSVLCSLCILSP